MPVLAVCFIHPALAGKAVFLCPGTHLLAGLHGTGSPAIQRLHDSLRTSRHKPVRPYVFVLGNHATLPKQRRAHGEACHSRQGVFQFYGRDHGRVSAD
jgi:hypothetical protein